VSQNKPAIFACVKALDRRRPRGGDYGNQYTGGKPANDGIDRGRSASAKRTAEVVGTSSTKVERARMVLDHGDKETQEAVLRGEKTISAARTETQAKRKAETEKSKPSAKPVFNDTNDNIEWAKWTCPGGTFFPKKP